jgi:hypothetical protein
MATPKVITIDDLSKTGRLTITRQDGNVLQFEKNYQYLDDQGQPIALLRGSAVVVQIEQANVPASILAALNTINNYLYDAALAQEGMT